jgi:hypothetical protein
MHYKNGREAKVGDPVVGKTYNTGSATISGTLISLTPGADSCSCEVGYLVVQPEGSREDRPVRLAGSEKHGGGGPRVVTGFRFDYSQCSNLLHAEDAVGA